MASGGMPINHRREAWADFNCWLRATGGMASMHDIGPSGCRLDARLKWRPTLLFVN